MIPTLQEESFNTALIYTGIKDILKDQSDLQCESFIRNILEISHKCKEYGIKEIIILSLVVTENIDLNLLARVNVSLCNMCRENGFCFILDSGKTILANNFIYCINNYFLLTHTHTFDRKYLR